jgi:hypothetical protein
MGFHPHRTAVRAAVSMQDLLLLNQILLCDAICSTSASLYRAESVSLTSSTHCLQRTMQPSQQGVPSTCCSSAAMLHHLQSCSPRWGAPAAASAAYAWHRHN